MGCVGSTSARTSSPTHHQQRYDQQDDDAQRAQTPARSPTIRDAGMELVGRNLRSVLHETDQLVAQIGYSRATIGESLRPVHEAAISLRNRIREKMAGNPLRGSGADNYRQSLERIRHDFNAISSADIDNSRYFEQSMIMGYDPTMPGGR